jgi:osmotically-inducible protein OsmY
LLLALAAFLAACASSPPRTAAETEADRKIELAVTQQLDANPHIYAAHISVSVHNGVVTLTGFVFEPEEVNEAKRTAALVPGVKEIKNHIELELFSRSSRGSG